MDCLAYNNNCCCHNHTKEEITPRGGKKIFLRVLKFDISRLTSFSLQASSPGRSDSGAGKGKRATTSLEFKYLHRKSRCEMLIGGDDISNDVTTLDTCFHVFSNVCLHLCSFPLRADWRKSESSVDGEPQGNWRLNLVASSPSFSRKAPQRTCSQADIIASFFPNSSSNKKKTKAGSALSMNIWP